MTEWSKPKPASRVVLQAGAAVPAATPHAQSGVKWVEEPTEFDAILLASYGGPNGQDDVIPFLRNVTAGRGIPDERLEEVAVHYRERGGVSPINEQNLALKEALEKELVARGIDLPIYFGNRNWEPYFTEAIHQAHADAQARKTDHTEDGAKPEPTKIFALVTSAYSTYSSNRQYREDFADALEYLGLWNEVQIDKIRAFFDHPGFVTPFIEDTIAKVRELQTETPDLDLQRDVDFMFAGHSIPLTHNEVSDESDEHDPEVRGTYEQQHVAVAELIVDAVLKEFGVPEISWQSVWQSESGPAWQKWLEPDIGDAISELDESKKAIIVVPVTFLSDHMEVWWDLDNEAKEEAEGRGLIFKRVATPGTHPEFVSALVDLVEERLKGTPADQRPALTSYGPGYDVARARRAAGSGGFRASVGGLLP
ncbi:ferrochelatase [Auritidibacter sp. NML120636]|uniref:ferrochelatase n=1 Tax=Auritidibacter sp. NML120636 TaxID=2170743 RepID=UPI000D73E9DE|nr:ferrochelatase [Auritidibacter sp. NML120636]PXA80136.1 ferrochelatase [Auritidibacter sp. NML120636]